jgi:hypothetical protein
MTQRRLIEEAFPLKYVLYWPYLIPATSTSQSIHTKDCRLQAVTKDAISCAWVHGVEND